MSRTNVELTLPFLDYFHQMAFKMYAYHDLDKKMLAHVKQT